MADEVRVSVRDNSLLARLERAKAIVECHVLIQDAIDEINSLRSTVRFVHSMTARQSSEKVE